MLLEETQVLSHVAGYFQAQGYRVWYNPRGLGALPLPTHQITVAGRYPDLLAIDPKDQVVAVETKGSNGDLAKGLGQALIYKQGAHVSLLAAPGEELRNVEGTALAHGLGVLAVDSLGVQSLRLPTASSTPRYLRDVQRELSILAARGDQTRRLGSSSLRLNHPLHYIAPVLFVDEEAPVSLVAASLQAPEGWGLGETVTQDPVAGAKILGLLTEVNGVLVLTEKGKLVRRMLYSLKGDVITLLRGLRSTKPLIDQHALLGGLLQFLFLEDPDVRDLRDVLRLAPNGLTLRQLLRKLADQSPNIVLNVFSSIRGKERVAQYLAQGTFEDALGADELPAWLMKRSCYQLKRQLVHVGILKPHPARGGHRHDEYLDLDNEIWQLRG